MGFLRFALPVDRFVQSACSCVVVLRFPSASIKISGHTVKTNHSDHTDHIALS